MSYSLWQRCLYPLGISLLNTYMIRAKEIAMSRRQGYIHDKLFNMDSVIVSCPKTLHELLANLKQLTQQHKIRLIILDSISFLGYSIENVRERTQIYFRILDKLQELSVNLNLPVVVTSELSTGVTSTGDVDLVGAGGTLLAHRIHKRLMLTRLNATQFAAHALKSPNIPKVAVKFQVDADGIKDVISSTRHVM